jgi:Putative outer membrane beta-barrel porin, MtrB/PioB
MGSFWTTNFDSTPVTAFQVPSSYLRQNASVEAVWRPNRHFQFSIAPSLETWNRSRRQVSRLNEWGGDTGFIVESTKWFNTKINYHYGYRNPQSAYVRAPNEFEELRDFDQDRRVTNNPWIVLNFGGKGPWLVSVNYNYMSQAHDQNFFGLSKYLRSLAGVDVNYAPSDRWGVAGYYNHERLGISLPLDCERKCAQ